ncbi:MAG: phenylacetate--CoA ligase family protein [Burkholderiales bacterium]|nr:phenylacetate--CoA ligase family protein [Burkholderiales bacterium]
MSASRTGRRGGPGGNRVAATEATSPSLYTRLAAGVLFPLHERLKGHASVAIRERLERSQWLDSAEIEREQSQRLREFLVDIGARVPYYRELFQRTGFDPQAVRSAADLQRLPLLTKADIRAHGERMKADGHGPLSRYNTGGSSGEPLVFYIGRGRKSHDVAAKWRATRWWGVDIGDREAVIWGSPIEHGTQDRMKALRDGLFRSTLLPAFEMSESRLDQFVAWVRRHRPTMLFGYPSALTYIARHAEKRGQRLDDLGVKVAFVTSERLYDEQRETIARVFGCRVANGYGGRDAGFIAHECPAGGMHLSAEDIVVEAVDGEGRPVAPGQPGELVVTELSTAEFPFVRYRTGDVGVLDESRCPCGRGLPLLRDLQGRTTDFVVAADGTVMHGLALIYILRDLPGIEGFKVTQETRRLTRVQIVPDASYDAAVIPTIVQGFQRRLGAGVEVQVLTVASLPRERSGKYRYIVSHAL